LGWPRRWASAAAVGRLGAREDGQRVAKRGCLATARIWRGQRDLAVAAFSLGEPYAAGSQGFSQQIFDLSVDAAQFSAGEARHGVVELRI
jgi:hypothetical protein